MRATGLAAVFLKGVAAIGGTMVATAAPVEPVVITPTSDPALNVTVPSTIRFELDTRATGGERPVLNCEKIAEARKSLDAAKRRVPGFVLAEPVAPTSGKASPSAAIANSLPPAETAAESPARSGADQRYQIERSEAHVAMLAERFKCGRPK